MLLKRKRSDHELSPFSSSSPLRASVAGDVPTLDMDVDMDMNLDTHVDMGIDRPLSAMTIRSPSRSCTLSHLPGRTFKRLRNGRPSDHEVHQNTLQMLYRAQKRPQQPQHIFSPPPAARPSIAPSPVSSVQPHSPAAPAPAQSQRSLHSFWNIPSSQQSPPIPAPHSAPGPSVDPIVDRPTTCDDCGVELGGEDAAVDDGYGFETYISSCSLCCKAVCFSCSVSNLGEQRRCLVCAGKEDTRKRRVGTTEWASESMSVY